MQSEVVEDIAASLNAIISKDEIVEIQRIPTKSKLAYSYYLQAEFQKNKSNELSFSNAIELNEKAISLDENFIEPYLSTANIWNLGGGVWGLYDEQEAWGNAKKLLKKVVEIDPENLQAEEELYTGYFFYDWDFELVEAYYQNILKNNYYDRSPVISLDYAVKTGRPENTLEAAEQLMVIYPSNVFFPFFKAEALKYLGTEQEARNMLLESDPLYSDNWFYLRESAKLYYYLEDYKRSKTQLEKILSKFTDFPPILMWLKAVHAEMDGDLQIVERSIEDLHQAHRKGSSGSPAWFLAMYYCTIEDYEKVLEWLEISGDKHEVEMTWIREEPLLAPLRNDPRYRKLYEKVGFSKINLPIKTALEK